MSAKTYPVATIYVVHEDRGKVSLASAQGTVHGTQIWALDGNTLGEVFSYARRIDRSSVDETAAAAIARFVKARRARASDLREEATRLDAHAHAAELLRVDGVECTKVDGVVVDTDRDRVLAYLRAAPVRDRIGQHYYPAVDAVLAQALETDGLVRLVDWRLAGPNGCWLVDLLEIER